MARSVPIGPEHSSIRQLLGLGTHPFAYLDRCQRDLGDVFTVSLFRQEPMVFIGDHAFVRWVFSQPRDAFTHFNDQVGLVIGDRSVLLMDGEPHRRERQMLMPLFHGHRMRAYGGIMVRAARRCVATWPDGAAMVVRPALQRMTMEVISECLFGTAADQDLERLHESVERFLDAALTPWLWMANGMIRPARVRALLDSANDAPNRGTLARVRRGVSPWHSLAAHREDIDHVILDRLSRYRAGDRPPEPSVLGMLAQARDDEGTGLTDLEIRDEVLTLLMAGHETTATTLAWALHHISHAPLVQERLHEELLRNFPDRTVDPGRIGKLEYLGAVVNETLRISPIALAVVRRLAGPARVAGLDLPAGTVIAPSVYLAHHSGRYWERPADFLPERFLGGKPSPFVFFPFGGGTRRCVGAEFARYQLAIVLGQSVLAARFTPAPSGTARAYMRGSTVAPSPKLSVIPHARGGE